MLNLKFIFLKISFIYKALLVFKSYLKNSLCSLWRNILLRNQPATKWATTSVGLIRNPTLEILLGQKPSLYTPRLSFENILGWGRKSSGLRAVKAATKNSTPFMLLEDGFLRSVGRNDPSLSIIFDDIGIYYDASSPSRLESEIPLSLSQDQIRRSKNLIKLWQHHRLSKYNADSEYKGELPHRYVLVIDQTFGDASIKYGQATANTFNEMLTAALEENPGMHIIVKTHPDSHSKKATSHYNINHLKADPRIQIISESCHPTHLIEHAEVVYTVTSQIGFEALLWGKRVRCFGMPFYAGWGLTEDALPAPSRRGNASLEQLIYAALVKYPRYIDPFSLQPCDVETIMAHIGLQRQQRQKHPKNLYVVGFSRRKKLILKRFLAGSQLKFIRKVRKIPSHSTVVAWGSFPVKNLPVGGAILRVEDGFMRSSGLGAAFTPPLSWVIDDMGIYYDASTPSRLETILQNYEFDKQLILRAKKLREGIVTARISKYNLKDDNWQRPQTDKQVILVPGQVETDASIKYGTAEIKTNMDLLKAVRTYHPNDYIVYKPHPDVVAGLRDKGIGDLSPQLYCDEVVTSGGINQLLNQVDAVHTMTSLAGFEALLRDIPVTCYGNPFYAGWGLTKDLSPHPRRTRKLHLDELVAASLILYPTYISNITKSFATPEQTIIELINWRNTSSPSRPLAGQLLKYVLSLWATLGLKRNN